MFLNMVIFDNNAYNMFTTNICIIYLFLKLGRAF